MLSLNRSICVALTAITGLTGPMIASEPGGILSQPTEQLDAVLPQHVLDDIKMPPAPVRVATRPKLNWQPGGVKSLEAKPGKRPAAATLGSPAPGQPTLADPQPTKAEPVQPTPAEAPKPEPSKPTLAKAPAPELAPQQASPAVVAPEKPEPAEKSPSKVAAVPQPTATPAPNREESPVAKPPVAEPLLVEPKPAELKPAELKPVAEPPQLVAPNTTQNESESPAPPVREPRVLSPADDRSTIELPSEKAAPAEVPSRATPTNKQPPAATTAKPKASTKSNQARTAPAKAKRKPASTKPKAPPAPLTRSLRNLRSSLRSVLSFYYRKPLNTVEHNPWELMHGMLAYELHSRVRDGGPQGPYMTAVGHLCFNRTSKRQRMMVLDADGAIDVQIGVGLQGHKGQLLAMLAQCNVSPDYPIRVEDEEFTIHDLIEAEKRSCQSQTELTFKLIGLGHYLDSDATWLNYLGETWDIPRLIKEEREQPIRGAACGGTHRLAGLSLAFRRREARGEPVDGEYAEAEKFVRKYQNYAFRLQNDDGSLSTEWFRGPGDEEDIDRRLRTSGHLVEWLVYSLEDQELRSYKTIRAVNYLTQLLAKNADHEWHLGSIGHAIHALVLYDKRVFRPHDKKQQIVGAVDPTGRLYRSYPIYRGVMQNSPPEPTGFFGLFGGSRTGSASRNRK